MLKKMNSCLSGLIELIDNNPHILTTKITNADNNLDNEELVTDLIYQYNVNLKSIIDLDEDEDVKDEFECVKELMDEVPYQCSWVGDFFDKWESLFFNDEKLYQYYIIEVYKYYINEVESNII